MGSNDDKLRRLLDGELDLSEVADDPILASLAEKVYGVDLADIKTESSISNVADSSHLGFELHSSASPEAKDLPLPELPLPDLPATDSSSDKTAPRMLRLSANSAFVAGPALVAVAAANIYGKLGFLKSCTAIEANGGVCDAARERLSWLALSRLGHEDGWLVSGTYGIPTIGLIVLGLLTLILGFQGRRFIRSQ